MTASLEWGGYDNGYIPAAALTDVGGGILLESRCAAQFNGWRAELAAAGIPLEANEGYRDFAGQVYWKQYWTDRGKPFNAASPGYSIHGWAKAVDLNVSESQDTYPTVVAVGAKYGFLFDVSGEDWHASFRENAVTSWASGATTPFDNRTPEQIEEDELMTAKEDIVNSNKYYTEAAVANAVNQISAALQASLDRLLDAERRESRPRLYQINEPGDDRHSLAAAIDIDEGYVRLFGSPEELDKAKAQQDVAPEAPFPLSAADFDAKVAAANAVKAAK